MAPLRAISLRSSLVSFAARAWPPFARPVGSSGRSLMQAPWTNPLILELALLPAAGQNARNRSKECACISTLPPRELLMAEEKWSLSTGSANVRVDGEKVGWVEVHGLINAPALETLHSAIAHWAEQNTLLGYVLVFGWPALLTARGKEEIAACLRGLAGSGAGARMPAALLVPHERIRWAAKHCRQLSEHGLCRAAFSEPRRAAGWVHQLAPVFEQRGAAFPVSGPATGTKTGSLSRRPQKHQATHQTPRQVEGLDSLHL